jgi:hypothetical protein
VRILTMRGITMGAVDYEIVRVSAGDAVPALGEFDDVHATPTRYVAGYLMLEPDGEQGVSVSSHGRRVARLRVAGDALELAPIEPETPRPMGDSLVFARAGLGTRSLSRRALTLVHGPATSKIESRLELAESWQRVGGRR